MDSVLSSQSHGHMSLSERVRDTLVLLRGCHLSPFDLVLEILDEEKPEYSCYPTKKGTKNYTKSLMLFF